MLVVLDKQAVSASLCTPSDISVVNANELCRHSRRDGKNLKSSRTRFSWQTCVPMREFKATAASPTQSRVTRGWRLLGFGCHSVALPGQAGLLGAVPDAQDPRPGLSAGLRAGEGRAAGRGVRQDVAEQQAVEAAEHVHHTARRERKIRC